MKPKPTPLFPFYEKVGRRRIEFFRSWCEIALNSRKMLFFCFFFSEHIGFFEKYSKTSSFHCVLKATFAFFGWDECQFAFEKAFI